MVILKIPILVSLFFFSNGYIQLSPFENTTLNLNKETEYFLDISIFKQPVTIKFHLVVLYGFAFLSNYFSVNASFSNSLDFSQVTTQRTYHYSGSKSMGMFSFRYLHYFFYEISMGTTYKYLLFKIRKPDYTVYQAEYENFTHTNEPPCTGIELLKFSSLVVQDSAYIFSKNDLYSENYAYYSISFENKNNINSNQYDIYYRLEDYYDDRAFIKNGDLNQAANSKVKDNKFTFYYKLPLNSNKKYICLKSREENIRNNIITITHLKGLPTILDKSIKIYTHSAEYSYTNIANSPIGTEFYFKIIIIPKIDDELSIDFKFSDENYYEDYVNMGSVSPNIKTKDENSNFYYKFKKENNANYLLLHLTNDNKYNIIFSEIEKEEYQKIINKRILMATLIPIGGVIVIGVIVTVVIIYIRKKRKTESLIKDLVEDQKDNGDSVPLSICQETNAIK